MNPRWFRYCLLAAALAVALWRLPAPGPTDSDGIGPPPGNAAQAPPAVVADTERAIPASGR